MSAIQQQLQLVGAQVARDTQLAVLSAVSASLENVKQITAPENQQPAQSNAAPAQAQPQAPLPQGVGGSVDLTT
ncbi:hypothetical protein [Ferrovibrio sp.]|uniref:hypothetical protein n=1 Tax=Ferrovibrio sp. TaxID=1917215 RepID=UPI0025BF021F|nr:hypothetical protein [Ferrovibrio sp.]MBX3454119.1 hypothetical protein [Ferrovibrio sp.]